MHSHAKLAANAANAQLSTGPRTPEGKARAAQNARTHGLTARDLVLHEDEVEEFQDLLSSYERELQPRGVLERELFDQMVHAAWNLRRVRRLEAELSPDASDPLLDESADRALTRLSRYHARAERTYFRCLRELRALQTNRALAQLAEPVARDAAREAPLASFRDLTKRTHRPPARDAVFPTSLPQPLPPPVLEPLELRL